MKKLIALTIATISSFFLIACNGGGGETNQYYVSGTITGLTAGTLVLNSNAGDTLTVTTNSKAFIFPTPVATGSGYRVTIVSQPAGLNCTLSGASGTVMNNDVPPVAVTCTPANYTIGGTVTGLTSGAVVLQNNGGESLSLTGNGAFVFATPFASAATYAVTITSQPNGVTCSASNASGSVRAGNVTSITITCASIAYTVGGTVSGLSSGTLIVQINSGDPVSLTSNGAFAFTTPLANTAPFAVTVATQPAGLFCTVDGGTGSISGANENSVSITCSATTLSTSITNLALAVSGTARVITVTNTGAAPASNLTLSISPALPSGTSEVSTCGAALNPLASCTVTITPGATPTSVAGTAPQPSIVTISSADSASLAVAIEVLGLGNIYQGGYIFGIDDTPASNLSILGIVMAQTDQSSALSWYNGSFIDTSASSLTDGAANSSAIITTQGAGPYAAEICAQAMIAAYTDWYLPAICQMDGPGKGAGCASGIPNIQTSLVTPGIISATGTGIGALSAGNYWSSTQFAGSPATIAWAEVFSSSGGSNNFYLVKANTSSVRCVRNLTPG